MSILQIQQHPLAIRKVSILHLLVQDWGLQSLEHFENSAKHLASETTFQKKYIYDEYQEAVESYYQKK